MHGSGVTAGRTDGRTNGQKGIGSDEDGTEDDRRWPLGMPSADQNGNERMV